MRRLVVGRHHHDLAGAEGFERVERPHAQRDVVRSGVTTMLEIRIPWMIGRKPQLLGPREIEVVDGHARRREPRRGTQRLQMRPEGRLAGALRRLQPDDEGPCGRGAKARETEAPDRQIQMMNAPVEIRGAGESTAQPVGRLAPRRPVNRAEPIDLGPRRAGAREGLDMCAVNHRGGL